MPPATLGSPTNNGPLNFQSYQAQGVRQTAMEAGVQQKNYELSKEDIEVVSRGVTSATTEVKIMLI